ncbi:hypothetical protein JCM8547_001181 [Rhodosporidiobolus lusitaniae]
MATPSALAGTIATAMASGGPVVMFWGFIIVTVCSFAGAASLGELVSIWPTAEGQIAWTSNLAPPSCRRFLRFFMGWLTSAAWLIITCSANFICALEVGLFLFFRTGVRIDMHLSQVVAIVNLCRPSYEPTAWQICLIFWALMVLVYVYNVYAFKYFDTMNTLATVLGILSTIAIVAVLFAKQSEYNSATYAFTGFVNTTGWKNEGIVFILGMLGSAYSIIGYDSCSHLSDEMHEPARDAPKAMLLSVAVSFILGVALLLAIIFTLKDVDELATELFPFLRFLYKVSQSKVASVVLLVGLSTFASFAATVAILATSGRVIWSFSLEGGVPFSSFFSHISPKTNTPNRALAVSAVIQCLIMLIYIGNATLFNAILQLAISLANCSYAVPIALMLFRGRRVVRPGPFCLGPLWGPVCNTVALSYQIFISFFLYFPNYRPVTGSNMNYAIAIVGVMHLIGGIWWFCGGKATRQRVAQVEDNSRSDEEKE